MVIFVLNQTKRSYRHLRNCVSVDRQDHVLTATAAGKLRLHPTVKDQEKKSFPQAEEIATVDGKATGRLWRIRQLHLPSPST
jgi:hypothetical protein